MTLYACLYTCTLGTFWLWLYCTCRNVHPGSGLLVSTVPGAVQASQDEDRMPLFVNLLGFDPQLTVPMMKQYLMSGSYGTDGAGESQVLTQASGAQAEGQQD